MKILLVDDHPMVLEGMKALLRQLDDNVEVVTAQTGHSALELMSAQPSPSLTLLDITLPDMDGFVALRICREHHPLTPVVVLSASDRQADMQRALDEGAAGFIPKASPPAVVLSALRLVLAGGVYVPKELVTGTQPSPHGDALTVPVASAQTAPQLTPRQGDVLRLLMDGRSNKDIGRSLGCCESTVKAHVTRVLRALGVANRTQAARAAEKFRSTSRGS